MRPIQFLQELVRLNQAGDISRELRSRMFGAVFWILSSLAALGFLLTGGMWEGYVVPRSIQVIIIVLFILIWILWKRRKVSFAANLLVWGTWSLASLVVLSEAGRASHWLVPQFLLIVLARFILNGRVAILLAVLTAALDFVIYQFDLNSYLPMELRELAQGNDWAAIAISFAFLLFIFFLADTVLRETLRQARFTEGRYRSLFDKTNDAVFLIDLDLNYLEANQQAADLLGYRREELIGKPVFDVVPPEEAQSVRTNFERLEKEGSLPLFERILLLKDGSRRTAEVSITMVPDENGKPRYFQSVMRDVTNRKRLEEQLRYSLEEMETLAMQDSLTGLLNRRAITEHAEAEWHRSLREKRPMCIALIDLDNLKDVNDTEGHLMGDQVIVQLANVIKGSRRRYDWAGRWGGDEFMLVLPGSNLLDAQEVGERLRSLYAESDPVHSLPEEVRPYLSMGIACYSGRPGEEISLSHLIGQADKALYRAKQAGKNRVEIYRDLAS